MPSGPRPTDSELEILAVLWRRGASTVREVQEEVGAVRGETPGYTTILKLLQIMLEKGLVVRDEGARTHVYSAADPEEATQGRLVRHLLERAFGGSPAKLVQRVLSERRATSEELAEVRRLLDEIETKARKDRRKR